MVVVVVGGGGGREEEDRRWYGGFLSFIRGDGWLVWLEEDIIVTLTGFSLSSELFFAFFAHVVELVAVVVVRRRRIRQVSGD